MKKGVKKRVQRIKASGKASGKEAKQLARSRAKDYRSKSKAQKANKTESIGRGKKGSTKRELWKEGGTKAELEAMRSLSKTQKKQVRESRKRVGSKSYSARGTAKNILAASTKRDVAKQKKVGAPARPSIARAMYELRKAAGLDGKE